MEIPDPNSAEGQAFLNSLFLEASFLDGFCASSADAELFKSFSRPPGQNFENLLRWHNNIASFGNERKNLPTSDLKLNISRPAQAEGEVNHIGDSRTFPSLLSLL